jgi:hypothetical protein
LTNGTNYTFTVWALNSFGPSAYSAASGSVTPSFPYIEDVFSTWLYTGTGASLTIPNGIDLAANGGLTWTKSRSSSAFHKWYDSARGIQFAIESNTTDANQNEPTGITSFNSNGYTYGTDGNTNSNGVSYVSWTFREQPKFFDVVTYTGNGIDGRVISHALGSIPGMIVVKCTSSGGAAYAWRVYHRSLGISQTLLLNDTSAAFAGGDWSLGAPTDSTFTVRNYSSLNENGATYVAYLFAHDAGGFGLTGTDNVISCGSFTVSGNAATVNLGYEPQWLLIKSAASVSAWDLFDSMRGLQVSGNQPVLNANNSGAEFGTGSGVGVNVTSTGFATNGYLGNGDHIYIAIRRGPMKTPTTGTSVYSAVTRTGTGAAANVTAGFAPDLLFYSPNRSGSSGYAIGWFDRLRGTTQRLASNTTGGESNYGTDSVTQFGNTGVTLGVDSLSTGINFSGQPSVDWMLGRAPGFFDVVCYTGTGSSATSYSHNLGVAPELIINKVRSASGSNWIATFNFTSTNYVLAALNLTIAGGTFLYTDGASIEARPTSTAMRFTGGVSAVNDSGQTYVAYLFASCPGVSKVGSYTGTGALQTINCGFTGGARFVLIKRTDSTGDWWVYDSARGITSGNDPYLFLNSTAAEVTNTNYVDTTSVGFQVTAAAPAGLNANGGTFVFLAIS